MASVSLCIKAVFACICVLAEISDFETKPLMRLIMKRIVYGASTCVLALGGSIVGTFHGAIKGQTTETGFLKGAVIGAIAGAISGIQFLDSLIDGGQTFSKAALLRSLVNGNIFMEFVRPAMLKAYQYQVSTLETAYMDISDVYDTTPNKGLSQICIQKLIPSQKYHNSTKIHSHDCSICLQEFKDGERVRKAPKCGHWFHMDCIDQWLSRQETCPVCRVNVCSDIKFNEMYY